MVEQLHVLSVTSEPVVPLPSSLLSHTAVLGLTGKRRGKRNMLVYKFTPNTQWVYRSFHSRFKYSSGVFCVPKPVLVIGSRAGQPFTCGACISVGETKKPTDEIFV